MIVSSKTIKQLLESQDLRISVGEEEIDKNQRFEGSKIELSLGMVWVRKPLSAFTSDPSYIGVQKRMITSAYPKTPEMIPASNVLQLTKPCWRLQKGTYLLQTQETICMPETFMGMIQQRTSIFRAGGSIQSSFIDPGFHGKVAVGITIPEDITIVIEEGAKFLNMWLVPIVTWNESMKQYLPCYPDEAAPYKGIWKGAKVTTDGVERGF